MKNFVRILFPFFTHRLFFSTSGFTFSFPMIQKGLDVGILVTWTKTFNCPSVVGRDAVQMLREAINRRGDTHVEVLAVLNDTAGKFILS